MNGSYDNNNFIVHLCGLPWNTTQSEVENFLQGCKIRQINFTTNDNGRATGECFVVLESQEDMDIAKNFHQANLGSRMY
jgi:RNA recognition motif-containing protein